MKAYLVSFTITTRVICKTQEEAIDKAIAQILENGAGGYITHDNSHEPEEDTECPAGSFDHDAFDMK